MPLATGINRHYEGDGVAIYHGDCLRILPALPAESVDFVLTDPPYLVNYTGRWDGDRSTIVGDNDSGWILPAYKEPGG